MRKGFRQVREEEKYLFERGNCSAGLLGAKNKAKERIYPKISAMIDSAAESHF